MFFCCTFSLLLVAPFYHNICCKLFPFLPPRLSVYSQHSLSLLLTSCSLSQSLVSNLSSFNFLPTSNLSLPPLHHFIFVLVQLQKWDLAVTNLLAKPPRAPCGRASSQRTHVIDWTWGKLCQAGHHYWISWLIINSLLPHVLWGDTSVMWRIFMTHGALDCYAWCTLPVSSFSYMYSLTLPWLNVPDHKTFLCAICWNRIGCERKIGQCVFKCVLLWIWAFICPNIETQGVYLCLRL